MWTTPLKRLPDTEAEQTTQLPSQMDNIFDLIAAIFSLVCLAGSCFFLGKVLGRQEIQTDAVKNGAAVWVINEEGNPSLHWRVNK